MDTKGVKSNWNDQKAKLKVKFPVLTDQDLTFEDGKKGEMFEKIQTKLGKTKEELQQVIAAL
ncbi:MAG: general stress protein CsbD [Saprospiraceae bacterium]|nr:general stress protein CsbD [Saprospiraceae bacterium]